MLSVRELRMAGRRADLVAPTSFGAPAGALTLVQANGAETRTALALAASGRFAPDAGLAAWGAPSTPKKNLRSLRRASALVDSPSINEAERHVSVRGLVAEDLALLPRRGRAFDADAWLTVHAFEDVARAWAHELPPRRRVELLTELALADPAVRLLVVDSPDRHSDRIEDWLPRLEALAENPGRELAVVAIVGEVPIGWEGRSAVVGNAAEASAAAGEAAEAEVALA
ncbi:ABC transporter ATP-binding protein [Sinomonas sp. JGH33]|uniref:ABC transporter ATP-binding protein n=1 Tax=Sinomonas terricola TaxID=3110330 RepID=A0ABU5T9K7_9MICC|nr:ABC transporter ATP-binding protein [Sinomonas sp. JGH33]MEA5456377.1 ABC transporter ATP-binding protein [Sinomonas sp. JGH33]